MYSIVVFPINIFEVYPVSKNLKAIVYEICPHKNQSANFKMLHLTSEDMTQYFKKVTIVIMAKTRVNSLNAYLDLHFEANRVSIAFFHEK